MADVTTTSSMRAAAADLRDGRDRLSARRPRRLGKRARAWADGKGPPTSSDRQTAGTKGPRDVFMFMISGAKVLNPAPPWR